MHAYLAVLYVVHGSVKIRDCRGPLFWFPGFCISMHDFKVYSEIRLTCNARLSDDRIFRHNQHFASLSIKRCDSLRKSTDFKKGYPDFQSIIRSRSGPSHSRAAGSEDPKQTKSCFVIASDICNIAQTTLPESYLINELIVSGTPTTIDDVISTLNKPTRSSP